MPFFEGAGGFSFSFSMGPSLLTCVRKTTGLSTHCIVFWQLILTNSTTPSQLYNCNNITAIYKLFIHNNLSISNNYKAQCSSQIQVQLYEKAEIVLQGGLWLAKKNLFFLFENFTLLQGKPPLGSLPPLWKGGSKIIKSIVYIWLIFWEKR